VVRGIDALEVRCGDAHRGERHGQLGQRQRVERASRNVEQLEGFADVGHRLGADRVVGDEQRGELGDLGERGANRSGIGVGEASGDAGCAQRPSGVLRDARQGLGKLERR
jgi:hypothetical protein